ncbi:SLC13 family permease [Thalassotalea sp. LPB0316]|nr:SLC13 family permease [Thalassotalea sp. LPB0316]
MSSIASQSHVLMLLIFIGTFIGLVKYQKAPEKVFASSCLIMLLFSLTNTEKLFQNAVNPGLVTLILLIICSFALERTTLLAKLSSQLFNGSKIKSSVKTLTLTALSSALLNNTAVVAALLNSIKNNKVINPGKILLPVSYAAILGGTLTLVGTSTNLIVNSLVIEQGLPSLNFFDFTLVGLFVLSTCFVVIALTMMRLPDMAKVEVSTNEYFVEAKVLEDSKLIGRSVEDNGLRNLDSLFLVEVIRRGRLISPVAPDEVLEQGDKLIFTGDVSKVLTLKQFDGLSTFAEIDGLLQNNLTEVMIKPGATVIGKTLKSAGFRARFDAAVVAIRRDGERLSGKLGEVVIKEGDFFVLAVGNDFSSRTNLTKNFYILSGHEADNMLVGKKSWLTFIGFVGAIAISVLTEISLLTCLIFYLAALIFSKSLALNEIKRRFPIEIWIIVLSALTLADGLNNSGLSDIIASNVEALLNGHDVYFAFIAIFIITLITTELVTNNAAAALVFPIAYNIAIGLGVNPMPFIMAVAFGASGSFISPYGYQTNVMVYNAGNYKLTDFVKFGLPVSIVYSASVLFMIPRVFPF